MARRSSGCSPMSEPSADCAPRKDCCWCVRNTPVFAASRSSPFRRKGSCAIRAPPNCSTRRSNKAATWSAGCPGTNTATRMREGTSTSASISPSGTISTSTCWSTIPTTRTPAASNTSRSRRCARDFTAGSRPVIAAPWRDTMTSSREDHRHGRDRERHHFRQHPHQSRLLGALGSRAQAARHCARQGIAGARGERQDDVDDPYYPFGKPDQLEVALMMAHTAQLTLPHELEQVFDMVTVNAARAARLPDYGIAPGNKADLVVVGAPSVRQALRLQPPRRHVIKNGVEIARTSVMQELRGP